MCGNGNRPFISVFGRGLNICLCGELEELYVFVCVCSYVLLEDEAGQQGGGLFDRQIVEETVENHLRQKELIATGKINAQSELLDDIHYFIKQNLIPIFLVLLKQWE